MSVRVEGEIARLEGECGVGDAESVFAALASGRVTTVDITECSGVHAAVAQALMQFSVAIIGTAKSGFLQDFVAPALKRRRNRVG